MKYLSYVNVKQGSKSVPRFSNGNTLPLTQTPFGMAAFAPQTNGGGNWWYSPDSYSIEGIRLTHQPSPWIGDYGTILITPQSDAVKDTPAAAWSGVNPKKYVLAPDYINTYFHRARCMVELTPSEYGAVIKMNFDTKLNNVITLFNIMGNGYFEIENDIVRGYTTGASGDMASEFKMYFVLKPSNFTIDTDKCRICENGTEKAALHIAPANDIQSPEFQLSVSYISYEQACINASEMRGKSFDEVRKDCAQKWEDYLSKIQISADEKTMKTFYSCMYRTGLYPHKAYEKNDSGVFHYSPYDGKIHSGVRYTGNGFWDTYRTIYPLFAMIDKEFYSSVLEGIVNDYEESGWLPRWIALGEVGCMPSTLVDAVIADAAVKNIIDKDTLKKAFEGMLHHANHSSDNPIFGREGISEYLKYGYVPNDKHAESVNLTLDFAYGDFCIAQVADILGEKETAEVYRKRALNYKNLFDSNSGFMRGKNSEGNFSEAFDPFSWGGDYTEASAWQTTFSVPHDLDGLSELMGGKEQLIAKLDELFSASAHYRIGGYSGEIHEMTEMMAVECGQCAINNQPSFLLPFIYAYFGETEKTEYWVKKICTELFSDETDGFPGDEDNGSMAAWYIFACLGLYPVCPGKNEMVKFSPLVKDIKICGKDLL